MQIIWQNAPIYVSETFFGNHTLIQLRKASILERTYTQIRVIRDENSVLESKHLFDSYFDSLKALNLVQAIEEKICEKTEVERNPNACLRRFLLAIAQRINREIVVDDT